MQKKFSGKHTTPQKILSGDNKEQARLATKTDRHDMFVSPIIEGGTEVRLMYHDGILDKDGFSDKQKDILKRSGVPLCIYKKGRNRLGGFRFEQALVKGRILPFNGHKYFVAEDLVVRGFNPFNMSMRLLLLTDRGLLTTYSLCGFFSVKGLTPAQVEQGLQNFLNDVRMVANGDKKNTWDCDSLYRSKQETPVSGNMIVGLRIHALRPIIDFAYITKHGDRKKLKLDM